ncbi:MAG: siderophore-interacting protein, partial [Microbacterium sp.]
MASSADTTRFFRAAVTAITELTPSFRRFTFGGPDLAEYGDPGYDQRVKVVFPTDTVGLDAMPSGDDWYAEWRAMDPDRRPQFRTYTTRL